MLHRCPLVQHSPSHQAPRGLGPQRCSQQGWGWGQGTQTPGCVAWVRASERRGCVLHPPGETHSPRRGAASCAAARALQGGLLSLTNHQGNGNLTTSRVSVPTGLLTVVPGEHVPWRSGSRSIPFRHGSRDTKEKHRLCAGCSGPSRWSDGHHQPLQSHQLERHESPSPSLPPSVPCGSVG